MVVTSHGRPVAVLTTVDENTVEESLAAWRRVRATQAIADLQRQSARQGTAGWSMAEINTEIKQARQERRRAR